jgi:hypothetical protein
VASTTKDAIAGTRSMTITYSEKGKERVQRKEGESRKGKERKGM